MVWLPVAVWRGVLCCAAKQVACRLVATVYTHVCVDACKQTRRAPWLFDLKVLGFACRRTHTHTFLSLSLSFGTSEPTGLPTSQVVGMVVSRVCRGDCMGFRVLASCLFLLMMPSTDNK